MNFFIPSAFAAANASAGSQNPMFSSLLMLVLFGLFIYLLMWRPQSKRMKQHRNMISSLKQDDEIVTSGGLLGRITEIDDNFIHLRIAEDIEVVLQKSAISMVLPKGTIK